MKISILGSGSLGNVSLLITDKLKVLIDCGMSYTYIKNQLKEYGIHPEEIDFIILTHDHDDHIYGLEQYKKRHNTQIIFEPSEEQNNILEIKDLKITSFPLSHDAEYINGYVFENNNKRIAYITDTGYINIKNHELLNNLDCYIIESNHDIEMLMEGSYPHYLKQRIISDRGHLSNYDAMNYLNKFIGKRTKKIVLFHLSEKNNSIDLVKKEFEKLNKQDIDLYIAKQKEKTELINID